MLRELKLTNFRQFDDEVKVRFRPITIMIGKNNMGKSSIINFLLMLKQSLVPEAQFLEPNGHEISLGSVTSLKNYKSKKRNFRYSLTVSENASPASQLQDTINKHMRYTSILDRKAVTTSSLIYPSQKKRFLGGTEQIKLSDGKKVIQETSQILDNTSLLNFGDSIDNNAKTDKQSEKIKLMQYIYEILRLDISRLQHMAPTKKELERLVDIAKSDLRQYIGKHGEFTLELFYKEVYNDRNRMEFLKDHINNILGISEITFKNNKDIISCTARNSRTNAIVDICNYGFGVSQCLPILVQGAIMPKQTHLILEQPEAQVHPTAQLAIGDYIADLWNGRKVGTIVETHSENILLRIRRLIATKELSKDDVSVAYFKVNNKLCMPEVINIDIDDYGEFIGEDLPIEFFGANLVEMLEFP